jgi:sugar phosphate isomerase/epimerase
MSTHPYAFDPLEERHLRLIAAAGFRHIELWGGKPHFDFEDDQTVRRAVAWLRAHDLRVVTIHLPFYTVFGSPDFRYLSLADADKEARRTVGAYCRRLVDLCPLFECRLVILHPLGAEPYDGAELDRLRGELDWFVPYCARHDVRIALENIMRPQTRTALLAEICRDYGPAVGICLDTGHANIEGGLTDEIAGGGGRVVALHAHDNRGRKDEHLLPGRGNINWVSVFEALAGLSPQPRYFTFELLPAAFGGDGAEVQNGELFAAAYRFWQEHREERA